MSDLLAAAAAAMGSPEHLVERSAQARATAEGIAYEEVLAAWAGGTAAPVTAAPPAPPATSEPAPTPPSPEPTEPDFPEPSEPIPAPPTPDPGAMVGVVAAPPAPTSVSLAEAHRFEAVITSPTASLTERVSAAMPRWLLVLFFAIPLIGLTYLITFAGGPNCGSGGQLSVDRLTGLVENCDGSEYEVGGAAGGVDVRALVGLGSTLYAAPSSCASCHGGSGEGGSGPALVGTLLDTFPMCTDHIEWVTLGTNGFLDAGRETYGALGTTVGSGGVMPSFSDTLTPEEIATVVFYERVVLGGQDVDEAVFDCGFAQPEDDPDNPETESEEPVT
ncbi:MAG: c-type cytochrome [bacterium]|nr:c-type cytochrome [bacterium]